MKKKYLLVIAIPLLSLTPQKVLAQESNQEVGSQSVEEVSPGILLKKSLPFTKKPKATDSFWDRLAWCETHSDWKNGGNWAGGLGIAQSTWYGWGGREFAKSPHLATREEQIIVAHRVSTQGYETVKRRSPEEAKRKGVPETYKWKKNAVGFGGWGALPCAGGKPKLFHYDNPRAVLTVPYSFNERGIMVKDLQTFLNIKVDGHYGMSTRSAHAKYLKSKKIPISGIIPPLPNYLTGKIPKSKTCPQYELRFKFFGLQPIKRFSHIAWRESRCDVKAVSKVNSDGSRDYGLLQINSSWKTVTSRVCKSKWGDMKVLLKLDCNIKVARYLMENSDNGLENWKATSGL